MRLKDVGYLYGGLTGKSGDDFHEEDPDKVKPFIPFTNVFKNFKVDVSDVRYVAMEAGEVQNRVRQGDVLFLMSSEDYDGIGKPAVISDEVPELYLNSFCRGLRITKRNICPEFVNYYLNGHHCREQVRLEGRGFTRVNIKVDRIAGQELKLPLFLDQRRIVDYLDSRCEAIDRKVALLERKRAAYGKLKRALINETVSRGLDKDVELVDSGADWIAAVPKGWTLRRLQDDYLYFKGLNITKDDLTDDGVPVVSYGQIHSKTNGGTRLKDELLRHVPPEVAAGSSSAKLKFGDYVFADTSEDIEGLGNCVLVDRDDGVFAGYHALVARPRKVGCAKYIAYQFQCKSWRGQLQAKAFGIKVFSVTQRMLKGVEYACPPISEQRRIADYLDRKCAAIDAAVENVTRQIELYRKLKRSLINEVVMGRRKVA